MSSDDYDEYDAKVRVPKGETLAESRDTPGARRGFTHSGPGNLTHAEIFLTEDGQAEQSGHGPDQGPPTINYFYEYAPQPRTRDEEELDDLLRSLVIIGLIRAAEAVTPHIRNWWSRSALPFIKQRWDRLKERRRADDDTADAEEGGPDGLGDVLEAAPVEDFEEVITALAEYEASISSEEARQHFVRALIERNLADARMRLLAKARIEDSAVPPELAKAVQALTPTQVEDSLNAILGTNPHLLDDLGQLIEASRGDGGLQLGGGRVKAALRLTEGDS